MGLRVLLLPSTKLLSDRNDARPNLRGGGSGNPQDTPNRQDPNLSWPIPFHPHGQDPFPPPATASSEPASIKTASNSFNLGYHSPSDASDVMLNSLYSGVGAHGEANPDFDTWLSQTSASSPLQLKVDSLVTFCFPGAHPTDVKNAQILKTILTIDNVQHFVKLFGNFHSHWPLLHLPTLSVDRATDGLLMTIVCVGAVYSDRISQDTVRWLMGVVKDAIFNTSPILPYAADNVVVPGDDSLNETVELQTLILLQALHVWHGTPETRASMREQLFPKLMGIIRNFGFLQTYGYDSPHCSILHQPGPLPDSQTLKGLWSWEKWIVQEKRLRAFYLLLLFDAASVIFFNAPPGINIRDIRLPLPADDAAWEARNADECANALGINGPSMQSKNLTGSRQPKQMHISEAFKRMQSNQEFPLGYTNVYSKFILIHALHSQIGYLHRLMLYPGQAGGSGPSQSIMAFPSSSSGSSTPRSITDWPASEGSNGTLSSANSGRATPVEGLLPAGTYPQLQHDLKALRTSLDKWKRMWDADLALQYPPPTPRAGFCRDGIHFYHLAHYVLRSKPHEWQMQPEARMQHAFGILNQIKSRVANEQEVRGLDRGSVADIDDDYAGSANHDHGVKKLTLDMKGLFTPTVGEQDAQGDMPT